MTDEQKAKEQPKFDTEAIREMLEYDYRLRGKLEGLEANYWQHLHCACDLIDRLEAENQRLREILMKEVDDGRAEVDDIGIEAWIEQALKEIAP